MPDIKAAKRQLEQLLQNGFLQQARERGSQLCSSHSWDADVWYLKGMAEAQLNALDEAVESLGRVLLLAPNDAVTHYNLARIRRAQGRVDEAVANYREALRIQPNLPEAHNNLAELLHEQMQIEEAETHYREALRLKSGFPEAWYGLGLVLEARRDLAGAREAYKQALQRRPEFAEAYNNLGNVLKQLGDNYDALRAYEQAVEIDPQLTVARRNVALLLQESGRPLEAAAAYQKVLEVQPDLAEAHYGLGNALKDMGVAAGALACYARALELHPNYAEARWAQAMSQLPLVAHDEAEIARGRVAFDAELAALERWCEKREPETLSRAVGTQQPFYLAYQDGNHRERLARYGTLSTLLASTWQAALGTPMLRREKRTECRIGIVSAHVRKHSVWHAILKGWLQHLDRSRIEVLLFHVGTTQDVETALAKTMVTQYINGKFDHIEWARLILDHQLDLLIYPEIGMDPITAKLASMRLAHVQAAAWGHPITTGLPTMDYFLSAEALEPPRADEHYTERLIRLPGLGCCYSPTQSEVVQIDLASLDIHEDVPLFVCAGNPFKYVPRHDALFVEIARRLGECQFVFFVPHLRAHELMGRVRTRMTRAFSAAGLDLGEYAVFVPWQSRPQFAGLMQQADVYLDTVGFSGFVTAMLAIECALPMVAWEGHFLRGRLASGILRRIGLDELVADTDKAYVEKAVHLARDANYRSEVRERIIAARQALYNDTTPVHALEGFLLDAIKV